MIVLIAYLFFILCFLFFLLLLFFAFFPYSKKKLFHVFTWQSSSDLAYGERGSPPKIPGGAALVFQMELLEIKGDSVPALTCTVDLTGDTPVPEACNQRESDYITKINAKYNSLAKVQTEKARIKDMKKEQMKKALKEWMDRRLHILNQFETYYKENEGKDDL